MLHDTKHFSTQWFVSVMQIPLTTFWLSSLFLKFSHQLLSVSFGQTKVVPSLVDDRTDSADCQPLISGLKLCTIARYMDGAPYYSLTGETR